MKKNVILSVGAGLLLGLAVQVQASTMDFTTNASYGPALTDWSTNLSLQKFNASLGTLNSVTITLNDSVVSGNLAYSNASGTSSVYGTIAAAMDLTIPGTGTLLATAEPSLNIASKGAPLTLVGKVSGSTSAQKSEDTSSTTLAYADLTQLEKQLFIGSGNFLLALSAYSDTNLHVSGSTLSTTPNFLTSGSAAISYNYTPFVPSPVPEPGTLPLILCGFLAGMTLLARRKSQRS